MRASDLFPGVALIPLSPVAKAIGLSPKTLRNQFYGGKNDIGIVSLDGRLVVPAESFDAWLKARYSAAGLEQLAAENIDARVETCALRRSRGRPRKKSGAV